MSTEGQSIGEVTRRMTKEPLELISAAHVADQEWVSVTKSPFECRWERPAKEGEKVERFEVEAIGYEDAAYAFAKSCDNGNPRPPASRVVIVRLKGDDWEMSVRVNCKPVVAYETYTL